MTPLIIGPADQERLDALRRFADQRENWRDLTPNDTEVEVPGDDDRFCTTLPSGIPQRDWRLVYSIDIDSQMGPLRHLSVSIVGTVGRAPNPAAMTMIGEALGIKAPYLHMGPIEGDSAIHLVGFFKEVPASEA